jgi:type II secretory pathway pseudopilin PulG
MKSRSTTSPRWPARSAGGFTLAESLAALAFLAIVIPVAVEGVRTANAVGQVAERKVLAARVADRVLNDLIATRTWNNGGNGITDEGRYRFNWRSESLPWERTTLREVTLIVTWTVQGREYTTRTSTVLDSAQP